MCFQLAQSRRNSLVSFEKDLPQPTFADRIVTQIECIDCKQLSVEVAKTHSPHEGVLHR